MKINLFTKIVWYIIAIALVLIVGGYIFEKPNGLKGLFELLLAIPTSLLLIFNLAYTNHQWSKKVDLTNTDKKSDIVGIILITIISLILLSCLYILIQAHLTN